MHVIPTYTVDFYRKMFTHFYQCVIYLHTDFGFLMAAKC